MNVFLITESRPLKHVAREKWGTHYASTKITMAISVTSFTEDWFDLLFGVHYHNLFLCTEIFLQSSYVSTFYYWNHNQNMVHNIEYKRFWCGNHELLKKDKREFSTDVTDIWNKIPDPEISYTISSKTNQHFSNCYQGSENLINLSHLFQVTLNFTWMNKYSLKM